MTQKTEHIMLPAKLDLDSRCLQQQYPMEDIEFSVLDLIDEHLLSLNGAYQTGGWIHPSSISRCLRGVYYEYVNAPGNVTEEPDERKLPAVGSAIHDMIQAWIAEAVPAEEFIAERRMRFPAYKLSFRCDGVFVLKDWVLEIKTVSDTAFNKLGRPRSYDMGQVHCYMYTLDIPRVLLLYVNRNTGLMKEFKVYFDLKVWRDKVLSVLASVFDHQEKGTKPPRLKSTYECRRCKWRPHCMTDE